MLGQDLVAYKVTKNARQRAGRQPARRRSTSPPSTRASGSPPRRSAGSSSTSLENKNEKGGFDVKGLLRKNELWFVPIVNPDGYDYTFTAPATRLWRKNLRDNNGDGAITNADGVDTNRNWPEKWNYDLEGASTDPTSGDLPRVRPGLGARGQGAARA